MVEKLTGVVDGSSTEEFAQRLRPSFCVDLAATEALVGLLAASGQEAHRCVVKFIASFDDAGPVLRRPLVRLLDELRLKHLDPNEMDHFWRRGQTDTTEFGAALLGYVASHGHSDAHLVLLRRAREGDLDALGRLGPVTALEESDVEPIVEQLERMVADKLALASKGTTTLGGYDLARSLAFFNLWFPASARWDILIDLLINPGGDKHRQTRRVRTHHRTSDPAS